MHPETDELVLEPAGTVKSVDAGGRTADVGDLA
jgi:hypothetical protein